MAGTYKDRKEGEREGKGEEEEDTNICRTNLVTCFFLLSMNNGCGEKEPVYAFRQPHVLSFQSSWEENVLLEFKSMPN